MRTKREGRAGRGGQGGLERSSVRFILPLPFLSTSQRLRRDEGRDVHGGVVEEEEGEEEGRRGASTATGREELHRLRRCLPRVAASTQEQVSMLFSFANFLTFSEFPSTGFLLSTLFS